MLVLISLEFFLFCKKWAVISKPVAIVTYKALDYIDFTLKSISWIFKLLGVDFYNTVSFENHPSQL